MIKQQVADLIRAGIRAAQDAGTLPAVAIPDLGLDHPPQAEMGDYATPVALKLARAARMAPKQIAEIIVANAPAAAEIASIEVAGQGFINIRLADDWVRDQLGAVLAAGDAFGTLVADQPRTIQVEFVSANPTGPIHAGNGRGAVLGDSLAAVLSAAGHSVEREYYINDAGTQLQVFGRTLFARYQQALGHGVPLPPDGYQGSYMVDLAATIAAEHGARFLDLPEDQAVRDIAEIGMNAILGWIREDTERVGVRFDNWFSERGLLDNGDVDRALAKLKEGGYLDQREGALWFTSTSLGDDKDNVIIRSSGAPTYFATDIAYHYDKFATRGFDQVIDVWGADHQGHVSRMKAVVGALGVSPDRLTIALFQLVTLKRGSEVVRLSKRTGDIVTLREVIDEVGPDAVRYFFLQRSADSQMDFDLELAKDQSDKNPVYYIQYAHARIASIQRQAAERGLTIQGADPSLLVELAELLLIRKMLELPEQIELAAERLAPQNLPEYAYRLASAFTTFYHDCKVVGDDEAISKARLYLVTAAKQVLANTLRLMGMSTPERMDRDES